MTGKIGTYQWMAPEVIASQNYPEKADVLAMVLYFGKLPLVNHLLNV
jgi:hypothetical protein